MNPRAPELPRTARPILGRGPARAAAGLSAALATAVLLFACDCDSTPPGAAGPAERASPANSRPSVVYIIIDTLRADKLGAYGFGKETSPEIDALAAKGVRFDRVISQCSWTRPSIGGMVTGIHPRRLGLYKERAERLPENAVCLSERFHEAGYTTVGVTANPNINSVFGFDQGFDRYADSNRVWPWMKRDEEQQRARRGNLMPANDVFETALELAREAGPPPYYLQLNIMEMHTYGARVREEYADHFGDVKNARYLNALRQVSADIGAFVERLGKTPGFEHTLLALTSDHGEGLDDHPGIPGAAYHGNVLYESQLHVPWILYDSAGALPAGRVVKRPVRNLEIAPTLADIVGLAPLEPAHGISLLPLLDDPEAEVALPENFVAETYFRKNDKIGVYSTSWKYFEHRDDWRGLNPRELQKKGGEERGAETDELPEHPDIAGELDRHLTAWESLYPKIPPTTDIDISPEETEQLKALGYID